MGLPYVSTLLEAVGGGEGGTGEEQGGCETLHVGVVEEAGAVSVCLSVSALTFRLLLLAGHVVVDDDAGTGGDDERERRPGDGLRGERGWSVVDGPRKMSGRTLESGRRPSCTDDAPPSSAAHTPEKAL
jgi:hypothetical protein